MYNVLLYYTIHILYVLCIIILHNTYIICTIILHLIVLCLSFKK